MNATLIAQHISKFYMQGQRKNSVLHDISYTFEQGQSYALTGPSGAGRSTLLHILAGIDMPSAGNVLYQGTNIFDFTPGQRAIFLNQTIGLVFQYPYLIAELSVLENVMIKGLIAHKDKNKVRQEAAHLLEAMGLADKYDYQPGQLSGGQQQRVALARALLGKPTFILADELTGNLDTVTGKSILELLITMADAHKIGLIICTHDEYVWQKMHVQLKLLDGQLQNA